MRFNLKSLEKTLANILFWTIILLGMVLFPGVVHSEGILMEDAGFIQDKNLDSLQLSYDELIEEKLKDYLNQKANKLNNTHQGQCVVAARNFLELSRSQISGVAKNFKTDSNDPSIGAIVKFRGSKSGHVGVVIDETKTKILVYHSNYSSYERASINWFDKNDSDIVGYKKYIIKFEINGYNI